MPSPAHPCPPLHPPTHELGTTALTHGRTSRRCSAAGWAPPRRRWARCRRCPPSWGAAWQAQGRGAGARAGRGRGRLSGRARAGSAGSSGHLAGRLRSATVPTPPSAHLMTRPHRAKAAPYSATTPPLDPSGSSCVRGGWAGERGAGQVDPQGAARPAQQLAAARRRRCCPGPPAAAAPPLPSPPGSTGTFAAPSGSAHPP